MFCGKCGASLEEGVLFCSKCGNSIIEQEDNLKEKNREVKTIPKKMKGRKIVKVTVICVVLVVSVIVGGIKINSFGIERGYDENTTAKQVELLEALRFDTSLYPCYTEKYYEVLSGGTKTWNEAKGIYEYECEYGEPMGIAQYIYEGGKLFDKEVKSIEMHFDKETGKLKYILYYYDEEIMETIKKELINKYGESNPVDGDDFVGHWDMKEGYISLHNERLYVNLNVD